MRLAVALLLAGCGAAVSTPVRLEVDGSNGLLHLAVTLAAQRGVNGATFEFSDPDGAPAPVVDLAVTPWMPQHNHGTSVTPTVENTAPGTYEVTQLYFPMPGTWQLRTTIGGERADAFVPQLDVP